MSSMPPELNAPSKEEILRALYQLERNPDSKERLFGDIGITALGGTLGAISASTVAGVAGSTSIWGITTAASWLGLSVVAATPVGWTVGAMITGAATVYGVSRLIRSGAYSEGKLAESKRNLEDRVRDTKAKEKASSVSKSDLAEFKNFLKEPLEKGLLDSEKARKLIWHVKQGRMELSEAYRRIRSLLFTEIQDDAQ